MLKSALGDGRGCIEALEQALEAVPTYAPALLSLGSVEYQRRRPARGRRLFLSLLERAVAMDPSDPLAAENLRLCTRKVKPAGLRPRARDLIEDRASGREPALQRRG